MLIYLQVIDAPEDRDQFITLYETYRGLMFIDLYRKKTHRKEEILWEETTGLAPAYEPEDGLTRCILKLPARYREFLRLKHELGYSTKEVAELMGISWPAARKLEQRARDRLEELCREEGIL